MLIRTLLSPASSPALERARRLLESLGAGTTVVDDLPSLRDRLSHQDIDLVIVLRDLLPDPPQQLLESLRELPHRPDLIVLRQGEDGVDRAALLAAGCLAVVPSDLADEPLRETLAALLERRRAAVEPHLGLTLIEGGLDELGAHSPAMVAMVRMARRVATADSTVFLLGETGVGKERLARAIHRESPRRDRPFIAVNCAALPETLLESELFGHEKGAFTGATHSRRGHFELAHGGTLFLDEVAEMTPALQGKLLRALEERTIQRLGGERPFAVDVRILAATSRDVQREIEEGSFRQDLYYRLAVVTLTVPPLRARNEDLPVLVENLLERLGRKLGRPGLTIAPEGMAALAGYHWPGNVRELVNVLERTILLAEGPEIGPEDLPREILYPTDTPTEAALPAGGSRLDRPLSEVLAETERAYLQAQLRKTGGHVGETARRAGLDRRSIYQKMKRHGLEKESFR